jgi:murein L,D-transpeptidase YcbB/YkuD
LTPPLGDALKHFQKRHGLDTDGTLGPATWRNLTRPLGQRVRQIELTLERWRWLPPRLEGPSIFINIPQFKLFAFSGAEDRAADMLEMDVVVGETVKQKNTPVFAADMTYLILRPYWDVPYSIATRELLPKIHHDPDYLRKNRLEIVGGAGRPLPATSENLQAIKGGTLRLRQQPGPENALGLVKFMLPNPHNVYLHDTPARALFARTRRAFSHGCIRLSDAPTLALYVLRDQPEWTKDRLLQAMNGQDTVRVNLSHRIRVFIVYGTVLARERGDVLFFEDLYGQDAKLSRLLGNR